MGRWGRVPPANVPLYTAAHELALIQINAGNVPGRGRRTRRGGKSGEGVGPGGGAAGAGSVREELTDILVYYLIQLASLFHSQYIRLQKKACNENCVNIH